MFGPIMSLCGACEEDRESDLYAHGPGVCVIGYEPCGHTMKATKEKTIWTDKDGNVVKEEIK